MTEPGIDVDEFAWAPDGLRIAVMARRAGRLMASGSARAARVGYRIAVWNSPVVPGGGGWPPLLSQVLRPMWWW